MEEKKRNIETNEICETETGISVETAETRPETGETPVVDETGVTSARSATTGTIERGGTDGVETGKVICGTETGTTVGIEIIGTRGVERDRRTTEIRTGIGIGSRGILMMKKRSKHLSSKSMLFYMSLEHNLIILICFVFQL